MAIFGSSGFLHKQQCVSAGTLWRCVTLEKKPKLRISVLSLNNDDIIILYNRIKKQCSVGNKGTGSATHVLLQGQFVC